MLDKTAIDALAGLPWGDRFLMIGKALRRRLRAAWLDVLLAAIVAAGVVGLGVGS